MTKIIKLIPINDYKNKVNKKNDLTLIHLTLNSLEAVDCLLEAYFKKENVIKNSHR